MVNPASIQPIAPVRVPVPVRESSYVHELKFDGFRGVVCVGEGAQDVYSKNRHRFTRFDQEHAMSQMDEFLDVVMGVQAPAPRRLAEVIAEELFVNGFGERAVRLALLDDAGRLLGDWSRTAVVDRVATCLEREIQR